MFEAVVIGLGPAGAAALRRLKELGVRAIGVERKPRVETPVVCGEFLPDPDAITFISSKPSVKKAFEYISMARKLNVFREVHLDVEGLRVFRLRIPGFTVSRRELVEKLVEGCECLLGDEVTSIDVTSNGYIVKTRKGRRIESKYIIAADGYPSSTRRLLGCQQNLREEDLALGLNVKMRTPNTEREIVYMYASPETPGGYAWIIPYSGDVSNVGVGIRYSYVKRGLDIKALLERFIELNPHGYLTSAKKLEQPRARWIPVSGFYASPVCGMTLFAGDSLGATNPINGGGIFTSMSLGVLAAEAVWLDNPQIYAQRAWNEVGSILHIGRAYRRLIDFMYSHWRLTKALRLAPDSLVTRIIKGEKTPLYFFLSLRTRS